MHDAEPDADTRRLGLLRSVTFANSYRGLQPWLHSTGIRDHELHHRALGQTGPRQLRRTAEEFLTSSRIRREDPRVTASTRPYFTDPGLTVVSRIDTPVPAPGRVTHLPAPLALPAELGRTLAVRRSRRDLSGDPIGLSEIATLLWALAGRTGRGRVALSDGSTVDMPYHTAPSGGGLRPVGVHVAALDVDGLPRTILRYSARDGALVAPREPVDAKDVLDTCLSPPDLDHLEQASLVLLLTGRPWRSMRKYGDRGLRFLLLEAGAMAQNAHLAADALGLGSVACGSLCDDEVNPLLGVDGLHEAVVHAVSVGTLGADAHPGGEQR